MFPKWVTANVCNPINKPHSTHSTAQVPRPKDCFKRREPGVSTERIEYEPLGARRVSSNECELAFIPWFAPSIY